MVTPGSNFQELANDTRNVQENNEIIRMCIVGVIFCILIDIYSYSSCAKSLVRSFLRLKLDVSYENDWYFWWSGIFAVQAGPVYITKLLA